VQAAVLHHFGSIAQNLTVEPRAMPVVKPGYVVVRLQTASINPSDLVFLINQYGIQKKLPVVPGFEGSGIVVEAGAGIYARWLLGKRVACRAPEDGDGTWAEYMACPATACIPLKKKVTIEQGASLYVNPVTAWCLLQRVKEKGHQAFIQTAAASAVGRMVARLARKQKVPAIHIVRRPEHVALLKNEGADSVLDSSTSDFLEQLKKLTSLVKASIALDAVGGSLTATIAQALPKGGEVVVYGALGGAACEMSPADLIFKDKTLSGFWLTQTLAQMSFWKQLFCFSHVQDLLGAELRTDIQARFPIEKIHEAIQRYKTHRAEGKVLLVY
jgi:NADPH2:quinone reductase